MFTGFLSYIQMGVGALAMFALLSLYDGFIDDPMVRREALRGYVLIAEKTAIQAQLAEERRRTAAAAQALEEHRKRLNAAQKAEKEASDRHEAEIAEYEAQLEKSGRRCIADQSDVDFLLRPQRRTAE